MRFRLFVFCVGVLLAVGVAACSSDNAGGDGSVCAQGSSAYQTGCKFLVTFYPRWFSYNQLKIVPGNLLFGPDTVDPRFEKVVAVNVDTLYASTAVDVTDEPVIVTLPPMAGVFSVLHLDEYGQALNGIPGGAPGAYGLTPPGWQGTLPSGVTKVPMPYAVSILILRADRYSVTGEDTQQAAAQFRRNLKIAPLSRYANDPTSGATVIVPDGLFSTSFKVKADHLVMNDAVQFLVDTQTAVRAMTTQPLTKDQQSLADAFDAAFANPSEVVAGAKAGYAAILDNYQTHTIGGSHWITLSDIANWDSSFQGILDRASITEYLQYGNTHQVAVYYHCFVDGTGRPLDGSATTYQLRFAAGQLLPGDVDRGGPRRPGRGVALRCSQSASTPLRNSSERSTCAPLRTMTSPASNPVRPESRRWARIHESPSRPNSRTSRRS